MKINEAKAVLFLKQYAQHKELLNEVVETLDLLDDLDKKREEQAQ